MASCCLISLRDVMLSFLVVMLCQHVRSTFHVGLSCYALILSCYVVMLRRVMSSHVILSCHHMPCNAFGTFPSALSFSVSFYFPPFGQPPAGSRALPAHSEALPVGFEALQAASRLTQLDLRPSPHCSYLRGSPSLLGGPPSWL